MYNRKFVYHFLLLFLSSLFITSHAYGATIYSLDPDTGNPGSIISITGEDFSSTGNTVYFRSTENTSYFDMADVDSPDRQSLLFTIPSYLKLTCSFDDPPCPALYLQVSAGAFDVYVITPDQVESNRLTFTIPASLGDVNGDNQIDIVDALLVAQYYVGLDIASFIQDAADVDSSGIIDIVDALLIARLYVGLINEFPVQNQDDIVIVGSDILRNMDPQPETGELESVVEGNNMFAFDCFQSIRQQEENIFFSPISISYAFAMCYAGANGTTEAQIASTMHFTLPEERLHNAFNSLELILTTETIDPPSELGDDLKLRIANSTWGQKDYYFVPEFLDILAANYGAAMNTVDFISEPENCRILINDWVSEKTENRINDLIPVGSVDVQTRLILTNAIYFKANWLYPFYVANTTTGSFHLPDGSSTTVPMMYESERLLYCEVPGEYCAVKLPYQGVKKNSMIIILPDQGNYQTFENNFTLDKFNEIRLALTTYIVNLTMPKFSYEWEKSLASTLQNLGMTEAFTDNADFSGINGEYDISIADVFHKSFVSVDEKGTEASAATAIIMGVPSMPEIVDMIIDRPFLYFIYNNDTGAILFMGRVLQV